MCPMDKIGTVCFYNAQLRKQHKMLPIFQFGRKQILKFMLSIPSVPSFIDPVLRAEADLYPT